MNKSSLTLMVTTALMAHQTAQAGAFSLYTESSAAAIGNFAAGVAAEGADASIGWYNPAGLVLMKKPEAVLSGVGVLPSSELTGTSSFVTDDFDPYTQSFSRLQGAEQAFVPAFHYANPLGERAVFGFSVVSPFGLSTNWGDTSPVRYSGTYSQLLTMTASPEIGGFLTDHLALGLGLDLQWARVTFNSVLGSPSALQYLESIGGEVTPTTLDSTTENQGTSFGVGFHAGILGLFHENHTRIGLNYQSTVHHTFMGNSTLTGRLADMELTNPDAVFMGSNLSSNQITLPEIVTLSGYQDLSRQWALLGSIVYTGWSSLKIIDLNQVAAYSPELSEQSFENTSSVDDYRNSWRLAVGANYHVTDRFMMRFGGGFDQTPTINRERDVRLPDSDRWALSIGSHYQLRPNIGLDVGYTHLFGISDAAIHKTQILGTSSTDTIDAFARNQVDLVGAQVVWAMG